MAKLVITQDLLQRVTRAICVQVQMNDFGSRDDQGNFKCTKAQLDLLDRVCDKAAMKALEVVRKHLKEQ